MTTVVYDGLAKIAAGESNDINNDVGSVEEYDPPWYAFFAPGPGPKPGLTVEDIAEIPGEIWTAAGETASSALDWFGSGLGAIWDALKWVLLAILVIVILVAIIVLR